MIGALNVDRLDKRGCYAKPDLGLGRVPVNLIAVVTYTIIKKHQGKIQLTSQLDQGSTFRIVLLLLEPLLKMRNTLAMPIEMRPEQLC